MCVFAVRVLQPDALAVRARRRLPRAADGRIRCVCSLRRRFRNHQSQPHKLRSFIVKHRCYPAAIRVRHPVRIPAARATRPALGTAADVHPVPRETQQGIASTWATVARCRFTRAIRVRAVRRRPGPGAPAPARSSPASASSARPCPRRCPPASAFTIVDGAVFAIFDGSRGRHLGGSTECCHGREQASGRGRSLDAGLRWGLAGGVSRFRFPPFPGVGGGNVIGKRRGSVPPGRPAVTGTSPPEAFLQDRREAARPKTSIDPSRSAPDHR